MNQPIPGKFRKRLIALLLLASCIISATLLVYTSGSQVDRLEGLAQADSLLLENLRTFNIRESQLSLSATQVDSGFTRKTYRVRVAPGFSKTLLHAELNRIFHPLRVETSARVSLPEQRMNIHLLYEQTVIRTLILETDPELRLSRTSASLIIAFDELPPDETVNMVKRLGEPIPIALQVSDGEEAGTGFRELTPLYPRLSYWIRNPDQPERSLTTRPERSILTEMPEGASVLTFAPIQSREGSALRSAAAEKRISFIDATEAILIEAGVGERIFKQELDKFAEQAWEHQRPVAIVLADEESLAWLSEKLAVYRKSGLHVIPPPEIPY